MDFFHLPKAIGLFQPFYCRLILIILEYVNFLNYYHFLSLQLKGYNWRGTIREVNLRIKGNHFNTTSSITKEKTTLNKNVISIFLGDSKNNPSC